MITIENYKSQLSKPEITSLPDLLQEGHSFFIESQDFYHEDNDVKEAIDLYLKKLNKYVESKSSSKSGASELRSKSKVVSKKNVQRKSSQIKNKSTSTKTPSGKMVETLHEEVKFIKRLIGFHNKVKPISTVLSYIKSLQRAIVQKLIRKSSPFAKDITIIQEKLVNLYNKSNSKTEVHIRINENDLSRYVSIVGGEAIYRSVAIIKRFIGMQGKSLEPKQIAAFLKYIDNPTINSNDPYFSKVQSIISILRKTKNGKLNISQQELSGLKGIANGCNCNNLGKIYDTGQKELRKCRSKKYSDAGRGACSYNKGVTKAKCNPLDGIMTANQVANLQFEKLHLTGKWKALIGEPATNFDMMIHGQPNSGKTTFLLQFAIYLAANFGNVLYVSSEEYGAATLTDKLKDLPSIPDNLHFAKDISSANISDYAFVILDSINDLRLNITTYKELREANPNTAFIIILQHTKDGQFKGGKEWEHEVEIAATVVDGTINVYRNRYGVRGNLNFFDK